MSRSSPLKVSVAIATYNGERFLPQQLASIQQQTRLPDEVVLCDDRSNDRTVDILREFAASVAYPVRIFENSQNLGSTATFEYALRRCEGDLIALGDQDDIWYPNRLERSEQELVANPNAGLIFSDGDIVDDRNELLGTTLWTNFGFVGETRRRLLAGDYTVLAKKRFVTGATIMFRSQIRENCMPVGPGWVHDEWIVALTAAVAQVRPIQVPLIRYRSHAAQQIGLGPKPGFKQRNDEHWNELSRQIGLLQAICSKLSEQPLSQSGQLLFSRYQDHLRFARFRYALPKSRLARLGAVLKDRPGYAGLGSGMFSMARDLVLAK